VVHRHIQEVVMAKEGAPTFEIPAEMRAFAEKSVEQAKQAFNSFISAAQHAVNTAETQAASARSGAKEVGEMALGFTQRNVASSFEFAEKLVRAKDAQELAALHSDYVKTQIATLTEQAKELSKQTAKLAGQAGQS
jgi:phasin